MGFSYFNSHCSCYLPWNFLRIFLLTFSFIIFFLSILFNYFFLFLKKITSLLISHLTKTYTICVKLFTILINQKIILICFFNIFHLGSRFCKREKERERVSESECVCEREREKCVWVWVWKDKKWVCSDIVCVCACVCVWNIYNGKHFLQNNISHYRFLQHDINILNIQWLKIQKKKL